jgi:hypothetical protein
VGVLVIARRGLVHIHRIIFGAIVLGLAMLLLGFSPGGGVAVPVVLLVGMASILYMTRLKKRRSGSRLVSNSLRSGIQWGGQTPTEFGKRQMLCRIHLPLEEAGDFFGG